MTLILNEIHIKNGFKGSFQIAAADRRITRGNKYDSTRRKIFPINYLNSVVSYFGLAAFKKGGKEIYFSDWLQTFIQQHAKKITSLKDFAFILRNRLNQEIPDDILKANYSGFHICGYNSQNQPEFWHFSNISGMHGFYYFNPLSQYQIPTSDFLNRDALQNPFKWDKDKKINNGIMIYRNGDFRTHALASEEIDKFMDKIFSYPDFNRPKNTNEYANYVRFKFEFISYIYKKWTNNPIIAKPIDVFLIKNNMIKEL